MKKLVQILLIMGPVILMAQKVQSDKMFTYSMELGTSKENLWNILVDFASYGDWDTSIIDVRCDDGVKKRKTCKTVVNGGQIYNVEITDLVENETYTLRHKLSSGQIYIKRTIEAGDKVKLTETVWYKGISKKTFEKYKGEQYKETQKSRMLSLKKYIEQRT
nr:hypothetical protein [Allomuricauda sp.]